VKADGEVPTLDDTTEPGATFFDEVVINQEAQIAPAYLIMLNQKLVRGMYDKWKRTVRREATKTTEMTMSLESTI
jgi:hypothetical protein